MLRLQINKKTNCIEANGVESSSFNTNGMGSIYENKRLLREFSGSTASKLTINSSINNSDKLGLKNNDGNNSDSSENENEEMSIEIS